MGFKISTGKRQNSSIASSLAGGLICGVLSAIGFYVALVDPAISGGIPFLADEANRTLGRVAFGAGAVITLLLALYAFREALALYRERRG
ncbi:MAG: hypothetical protein EA364_09630 [Balneolaceae bacterium]|nr:MAG: hypothetical protein EA364_09630 [Balneolaceae bacterium]